MIARKAVRQPATQSKIFRESLAISMMFVSLLLLLMLFSYSSTDTSNFYASSDSQLVNLAGQLGANVSASLYFWLGYASFAVPLFLILYSVGILTSSQQILYVKMVKRLSGLLLVLSLCGLLTFFSGAGSKLPATLGGYVGKVIASQSYDLLGLWGANLFLLLLVVVSISLFTGLSWLGVFELLGGLVLDTLNKLLAGIKHTDDNTQAAPATQSTPSQSVRSILDILSKRVKPAPTKKSTVEPKFVFMPGQSELAQKLEEGDKVKMTEEELAMQNQAEVQMNGKAGGQIDGLGEGTETIPRIPAKNVPAQEPPTTEMSDSPAAATQASTAPTPPAAVEAATTAGVVKLPTPDLLAEAPQQDSGIDDASLQNLGEKLVSTLKDFGIEVQLLGYSPGPVVTMFEVEPAAGIKSSRITNLSSDLSRSLAVGSVRVVEFIRGKSCIGIEVPNPQRQVVNFRQLIESSQFKDPSLKLPLVLGQDIGGEPVVADLASMPHLLVAGTTGSGKSIGINAMLISLLYRYTPKELRLILVDPKMLELASYNDIPNLLTPVITDMSLAGKSIGWCVNEMDRRYKLMADNGVRNIESYNEQVAKKPAPAPANNNADAADADASAALEHMPYIVIVIDEYADMIMVNRKVEDHLVRLAQKARAAGIHIVLATQRPSVDVITGLIKANVPARISFKVSSRIDSRTILDQSGAEQLLGKGDMLYMGSGGEMARRVHGAFVTDDDIHKVTDHCRQQGTPEYHTEVLTAPAAGEKPAASEGGGEDKDEFYAEAVEFVRDSERVSISSVQRKFKIGYNRAARIIEFMEEDGIVSPMDNAGKRTVLS